MLMPRHHISRRSLFGVFLALLWSAHGRQLNRTIDDSDPSIVYSPSTSWNSSGVACSSCNNPPVNLAVQHTFHKGVHAVSFDEDDDPPPDTDGDGGNDGDEHRRDDSDDPGFVDTPVFAQFNFTGTAVYIFCIQPQSLTKAPAVPSQMNMSFLIDGSETSKFTHQASTGASGFTSGVNIFAKQDLSDGPHSMRLTLAPNSVLFLDYILVTQTVPDSSSVSPSSTSSASGGAQSSSSSSNDEEDKEGRVSFGAVIGGVVGAFGLLSLGTAVSLYRRRRLAARRDRLERGDTPSPAFLSNPASFVPRYFPGTVIPHATPPTYAASTASSSAAHSAVAAHQAALAASEPLLVSVSPSSDSEAELPEPHTYSDEVPPPPEEDVPPPSFGVAITTPAITLLSSDDAANPPPRPRSWGDAPQGIPLPESNVNSRGASLTPEREEEDDDFIAQ